MTDRCLYSSKVYTDGTFAPYFGWSVVCHVASDFQFIENYLRSHFYLSLYLAPIPAESYHMTLFNIWSNGCELLPIQEDHLLSSYKREVAETIAAKSRNIGYFNPGKCIDPLLNAMQKVIDISSWTDLEVEIKTVYYNGLSLGILVEQTPEEIKHVNKIRSGIINEAGKNDGLKRFHVTLAYQRRKYRPTDIEARFLEREIQQLRRILTGLTFRLRKPAVCEFKDMTRWTKISPTPKETGPRGLTLQSSSI